MKKIEEVHEVKRNISFIVLLLVIASIANTTVFSSSERIDEETIEALIRKSFDLCINMFLNYDNIMDKDGSPSENIAYQNGDYRYYPGKGEYAKFSTLEKLKRSVFTEEMISFLFSDYNKNRDNYRVAGDTMYYYEGFQHPYKSTRFSYSLPENLIDNMRIVYNTGEEAYVILPYYEYSFFDDMIRVQYVGVYFGTTLNGVRITDISFVPFYFYPLPVSQSDKITEEEVYVLTKSAYNLAYALKHGIDFSNNSVFDISGIRFDKFRYYEDWVNIVSGILTDSKIDDVFANSKEYSWRRDGDLVIINKSAPQYVMLIYPYEVCKMISNGNGKAKAEIRLDYYPSPDYESLQILNLVAEFEKTDKGWRISGGEYYDYLFPESANPKTGDSMSLMFITVVLLLLTVFKGKTVKER